MNVMDGVRGCADVMGGRPDNDSPGPSPYATYLPFDKPGVEFMLCMKHSMFNSR